MCLSSINPFICTINPIPFAFSRTLLQLSFPLIYIINVSLYWDTLISTKTCYSSYLRKKKKRFLHVPCQLMAPNSFSLDPFGEKICDRITYTLSPIPLLFSPALFFWNAGIMITNSFYIAKSNDQSSVLLLSDQAAAVKALSFSSPCPALSISLPGCHK